LLWLHDAFCLYVFCLFLTSRPYGTLYIGWTIDLARRVWEHKHKVVPGFTTKYGVDRLVWFENHEDQKAALRREKQIKGWRRDWKITQTGVGSTSMTICPMGNGRRTMDPRLRRDGPSGARR
jgi:putative endonuclease